MKSLTRKTLVVLVIIALSAAAVLAIIALMRGEMGLTEQRILITTGFLGFYSLTGLATASLSSDEKVHPLSVAGISVSGIAFLIAIPGVWDWVDEPHYYSKAIFIALLCAVAIAHIALILHLKAHNIIFRLVQFITIGLIIVIHLMLIYFIIVDFNPYEFYMRVVGSLGILAVLGTIILPVISRIQKML